MKTRMKSAIVAVAASVFGTVAMGDLATALDAPYLRFTTYGLESSNGCTGWEEQEFSFAVGGAAARSGVCTNDGSDVSWTSDLKAEVMGPCTLSFSCNAFYRSTYDSYSDGSLYVYVDGETAIEKGCTYYYSGASLNAHCITLDAGPHEVVWSLRGYGWGDSYGISPDEQAFAIVDNVKVTPAPESMKLTFVTGDGEAIEPMDVTPGTWYYDLPTPGHSTLDFIGWYRDKWFVKAVRNDDLVAYEDQTLYARYGLPVSVLDTEHITFDPYCGWFVADDAGTGGKPALTTSGKNSLAVCVHGAGTLAVKEWSSCCSVGVGGDWSRSSIEHPLNEKGYPDLECGYYINKIEIRGSGNRYIEFFPYGEIDEFVAVFKAAIAEGLDEAELPAVGPVLSDFEWTAAPEFQIVTFETNGGEPIAPIKYSTGEAVWGEDLPEPVRDGYIFAGWYFDSAFNNMAGDSQIPLRDFTVYARWQLPISAMNTDDMQFFSEGKSIWRAEEGKGMSGGLAATLSSDGYYGDEPPAIVITTQGSGTLSFWMNPLYSFRTLYASINGEDEIEVASGEDFLYTGWKTMSITVPQESDAGNEVRIWVGDHDYDARWILFSDFVWTPAPESMTVTFNSAGGGKVVPSTRRYAPGDVFGSLPTPKRTGCRFLGWQFADDAMYSVTRSFTVEEDMLVPFQDFTLKAKWASESITVLPAQFENVCLGHIELNEDEGIEKVVDGGWNEIVNADGSRFLELEAQLQPGIVTADINGGGFLSFEVGVMPMNDTFAYGYADVDVYDENDNAIYKREIELGGEYNEAVWTTVRLAIPPGRHKLDLNVGGYSSRSVMVRNFVFEPLGPQESLAAWIGKLVDYKCWNEGDLARFVKNYEKRFSANAKDYEARISHAVAVLANLAESDAVKSYSNRFGLTIDYFRLRCVTNGNDAAEWPDMNELVDAAFVEAIPALASATADLMSIPEDWNGTVRLAASDYSFLDEDVMIDRADVLYARAAVEAAIGLFYFSRAYDWTTDWESFWELSDRTNADILRHFVMDQTELLSRIRDSSDIEDSKVWMEAALKMALDADTAAQLRTDGVMHLVEHDPAYAPIQAKARNLTQKALLSLESPQTVDVASDIVGEDGTCNVALLPDNGLVRVYLGALFSGRIVHDLAPTVSVEKRKGKSRVVPDFDSMIDPTLAGLLPDFTAKKWTMIYDEATNATHAVRCHGPKAGTVYSAAHSVTFFPAGADGEPVVQEFVGDSPQTLAPCGFVRSGFNFAGWATRKDGAALYTDGQAVSIYADLMLYALWNRALDDKTIIIDIESEYAADDDGSFTLDLSKRVLSLSTPTLTVKGLPSGLKYTAGTMTISGTATKPGRYPVTISAKSKTVKTPVTATFEIVVPNLTSRILRNLRQGTDDYEIVTCGVAFDSESIDCTPVENGWTVKVAGLPAGLKYDAKTGKIVGVPTKAGTFTVTFTATKKGVNEKEVATITLTTEALPLWATGTFAGEVSFCERQPPYLPLDVADGIATLTIGANGKVSGKVTICGTNWTFSAASCSGVERLCDGLTAVEVATVMKSGKVLVPVSFRITPCEASEGVSLVNAVADCFAEMDESGDRFLQGALYRSLLKDKATSVAAKAEIEKFEGVYTVSLDGVGGNCSGYGGYLSLVIGKDGTVKTSGKLVDGTAVSATSQLSYDAESLGGYGTILFAAPSTYKGGCIVIPIGFGFGRGQVFSPWAGFWESRNPLTAVGVYGDAYGECFCASPVAVGAYYDKTKKLNSYYDNLRVVMEGSPVLAYTLKRTYFKDAKKKITESSTETALAVDLSAQDGMSVSVSDKGAFVVAKATKPVQNRVTKEWFYNGVNDGALTLSFAQATGIFKGSYTFWYDYESAVDETNDKTTMAHVSKKVSFEGIMVQGAESLRGFYLWDATGEYVDKNKTKTYKYKESHSVSLEQ